MGRNRRRFLRDLTGGALLSGLTPRGLPATDGPVADPEPAPRLGPKPVARGKRAAASSSHPTVTKTMLDVLRDGATRPTRWWPDR